MKVHHVIFLLWGVVFVFWLARQFADYNRRKEGRD